MSDAFPVEAQTLAKGRAQFTADQHWPDFRGGPLYEAKRFVKRLFGFGTRGSEPDFTSHVGSCTEIGSRKVQEDAVLVDVSAEQRHTICIVSDGMGGHNCGDVASRVAVDVAIEQIKQALSQDPTPAQVKDLLVAAAEHANQAIKDRVAQDRDTAGMGCTLLVTVFRPEGLYWLSVGDSPLYLHRGGRLHRLNQDHSLAPQIDQMVKVGLLSEEEATFHPDRNMLTSALTGGAISRIDAHPIAFDIRHGDIFLIASDGLQFLSEAQIQSTVSAHRHKTATALTRSVTDAVMALDAKDQDNIGLAVVKVSK